MRGWLLASVLAVPVFAAGAGAQPAPSFDLPALLECRAPAADYFAFRRWISRGGAGVARGGFAWRPTRVFQAEYALARPATVFGLPTLAVGLTDNGLLALVDGITPRQLARKLALDPLLDGDSPFVANRLVRANDAARAHPGQVQVAPSGADALLGITPSGPQENVEEVVQVVTNLGQRGRTMVGCNYVSTAESPSLPFPRR